MTSVSLQISSGVRNFQRSQRVGAQAISLGSRRNSER